VELRFVLNISAISLSGIMIIYLIYKMPDIIKKQRKGELPKYQIAIICLIILCFVLIMLERIERL
jgi:hypothetical protein